MIYSWLNIMAWSINIVMIVVLAFPFDLPQRVVEQGVLPIPADLLTMLVWMVLLVAIILNFAAIVIYTPEVRGMIR